MRVITRERIENVSGNCWHVVTAPSKHGVRTRLPDMTDKDFTSNNYKSDAYEAAYHIPTGLELKAYIVALRNCK